MTFTTLKTTDVDTGFIPHNPPRLNYTLYIGWGSYHHDVTGSPALVCSACILSVDLECMSRLRMHDPTNLAYLRGLASSCLS